MDKKKIIFILIFAVISVLLGWAIYKVFFAPEPGPTTDSSGKPIEADGSAFPSIGTGDGSTKTDGTTELPSSGEKSTATTGDGRTGTSDSFTNLGQRPTVEQLVTTEVASATNAKGGGAKFYNKEDGKFYKVDKDGNIVAMSDKQFFNVDKVTWSPAKEESIIEYPDGANIFYNFQTKKQATLPKHWEDFSFSPQGDRIASKSVALAPENRWLISSDPDGSQIKLLEPMGANQNQVIVDWSPNQQIVALSKTGESLGDDRLELLFVGQNKENFKSAIVEGRGLETQWSPEGNRLLHSVYNARNEFKPELWIVNSVGDEIGSNRRLLNVSTWAHKCTMTDERFAYCGVPDELEAGAGFVPQLADAVSDSLYKIDTFTGLKTQIQLEGFHTIDSIFTDDNGETLYFTDVTKTGLFKVNL